VSAGPGEGGALHELAPAKVNLCLLLGPSRADGRHELVTVFQPLTLADRVRLEPAPLGAHGDEVECPGVDGDNLAAAALRAFRARTGWAGAHVRIVIDKRIPIAGGMAGGSADAAATLRLAARAAGTDDDELLLELAAGLGSDVPGQVRPRRYLATGAGERLRTLPEPGPLGVLVLPSRARLSTAEVYAEADRQGLARGAGELAQAIGEIEEHGGAVPPALAVNDLEPAARALCPPVDEALDTARAVGAEAAFVCGSGPTVIGVFADLPAVRGAAARLSGRDPRPIAVERWPKQDAP
jgi:4-diphosphocytidyl-2-C-methyl-D-erythritol kinase